MEIDGSTPDAEASSTRTPKAVLPPPPIAGLRNVARLRGSFDEGLPTLRLPSLPPLADELVDDGPEDAARPGVIDVRDLRPVRSRPVSPRSVLLTGPQLVPPVERTIVRTRAAASLLEQIEDPEDVDDGELVDDAFERSPTLSLRAATTLPEGERGDDTMPAGHAPSETSEPDPGASATFGAAATSMHAATLADGDRSALACGDSPAWSAHGAPVVGIPHDPTPIVKTPVLAVPAPAVLVNAIVAPARASRPRRRRWLVLVPFAVAAAVLGVLALEPGEIVPSVGASVPAIETASAIETLPEITVPPAAIAPTRAIAAVPPPPMPPLPAAPPRAELLANADPDEVDEVQEELVVEDDDEPVAAAATPDPPRAKHRSKPRKTSARKRSSSRSSSPAPVAAASPVAVRSPGAGSDATALLREAERAFADGRYATALHFADRSRAKTSDPRAARIAALSACRIGQARKAAAAYSAVPAGQRSSVRKTCRDRGISL